MNATLPMICVRREAVKQNGSKGNLASPMAIRRLRASTQALA